MVAPMSCMTMNIGTELGAMPAKVFESVRAMVTAGLAKLVDEVNQYAPAIHSPTANGTARARPVRTHPWITRMRPMVATTSDSHSAADDRCLVDTLMAGSWNIRLAITAPQHAPIV